MLISILFMINIYLDAPVLKMVFSDEKLYTISKLNILQSWSAIDGTLLWDLKLRAESSEFSDIISDISNNQLFASTSDCFYAIDTYLGREKLVYCPSSEGKKIILTNLITPSSSSPAKGSANTHVAYGCAGDDTQSVEDFLCDELIVLDIVNIANPKSATARLQSTPLGSKKASPSSVTGSLQYKSEGEKFDITDYMCVAPSSNKKEKEEERKNSITCYQLQTSELFTIDITDLVIGGVTNTIKWSGAIVDSPHPNLIVPVIEACSMQGECRSGTILLAKPKDKSLTAKVQVLSACSGRSFLETSPSYASIGTSILCSAVGQSNQEDVCLASEINQIEVLSVNSLNKVLHRSVVSSGEKFFVGNEIGNVLRLFGSRYDKKGVWDMKMLLVSSQLTLYYANNNKLKWIRDESLSKTKDMVLVEHGNAILEHVSHKEIIPDLNTRLQMQKQDIQNLVASFSHFASNFKFTLHDLLVDMVPPEFHSLVPSFGSDAKIDQERKLDKKKEDADRFGFDKVSIQLTSRFVSSCRKICVCAVDMYMLVYM